MEKARLRLSHRHPLKRASVCALLLIASCTLLLTASCAMPRMVILRDPLTASEHNDLGVIYEQKGQLDLAEKEYLKAVQRDGKWYLPLFNLGNLYYSKSDLEKAEGFYRRALALDSTNPDVMNNLACLLHDISLDHEAGELITKALSIERKPEYIDTYRKIMGYFPEEGEDSDIPGVD
jgi:tetratricopeptide (TPR) repeat protein